MGSETKSKWGVWWISPIVLIDANDIKLDYKFGFAFLLPFFLELNGGSLAFRF